MTETTALTTDNIFVNPSITRKVIDLCADGLMIVNREGIIIYVNKSFEEIHNIPKVLAMGRHVTDIIENTRMHIVAQTATAELDKIQIIKGRKVVVSRIPIIDDGQCVGAVGKIKYLSLEEVKALTQNIFKLEKKLLNGKAHGSDTRFTFNDIVAASLSSQNLKRNAMLAASSHATILLLGESGVGKEVFAQSIHALSSRCTGPFIRINCSAICEDLFEAELFGYEEGAFTGAKKGGKKGKFELADMGTIFLDEIGEMPLNTQAKLLRVIQEREIDKVGGEMLNNVDVRIIAATNKDLEKSVKNGTFRKDLFYRLNVIPMQIPPLRERRDDVPELIRVIWKELKKENGIYHKSLDPAALTTLCAYDWPGNIRELRNVLERALILVIQETITADHIQTILFGQSPPCNNVCLSDPNCNLKMLLERTEKSAISQALIITDNNRCRAAKKLGISRALLYKRLHYYGMTNKYQKPQQALHPLDRPIVPLLPIS